MCLILFDWQTHPRYSLVLAANRDEFHQRPTAAAHFWQDAPLLLAGRDLQAGGTWLGITRSGRFAAITNYREPQAPKVKVEQSRGHLVRDFLLSDASPMGHARAIMEQGDAYDGFSLLLGIPDELVYVSNRSDGPAAIEAGSHGLSNHLLDTEWPKVQSGRDRLSELLGAGEIGPEDLFGMLTDRRLTPGEVPENIDSSLVREKLTRHYFIVSPIYGTRSSTVLLIEKRGRVVFMERQFGADGLECGSRHFDFQLRTEKP
jgi:uncharacterized protein with NRDE domain